AAPGSATITALRALMRMPARCASPTAPTKCIETRSARSSWPSTEEPKPRRATRTLAALEARPHLMAMLPVTSALIAANVAIFLLQQVLPGLVIPFALWPWGASQADPQVGFAPWQLVTYAFLHGSLLHLAFNMFALYMFGGAIERVFGGSRYLVDSFIGS